MIRAKEPLISEQDYFDLYRSAADLIGFSSAESCSPSQMKASFVRTAPASIEMNAAAAPLIKLLSYLGDKFPQSNAINHKYFSLLSYNLCKSGAEPIPLPPAFEPVEADELEEIEVVESKQFLFLVYLSAIDLVAWHRTVLKSRRSGITINLSKSLSFVLNDRWQGGQEESC